MPMQETSLGKILECARQRGPSEKSIYDPFLSKDIPRNSQENPNSCGPNGFHSTETLKEITEVCLRLFVALTTALTPKTETHALKSIRHGTRAGTETSFEKPQWSKQYSSIELSS